MGFFSKKPAKATPLNEVPSGAQSEYESQLQAANANVYKHSLELAVKNKTLSLLGKLYEVSILTLPPEEMAAKVTSAIQSGLDFERVSILSYSESEDRLTSLGFSESDRFHAARQKFDSFFDKIQIEHASARSFFKPILAEQGMKYAEDLAEVWEKDLPEGAAKEISANGHVRSLIAYPLITGGKVIGVFLVYLNRVYMDLTEFEQRSIRDFINVVSVALEKASLYAELQVTNKRQEQLIHFVGHEVKGFLTKDQAAFAALAEGDLGPIDETVKGFVKTALAQTREGVRSVGDLLEASNQKKGTIAYKMEPFDVKTLVGEIMEQLRPTAEKKGLSLTLDATDVSACMVTGDRGQIGDHVFRNLIDNAINYTPKGSIALSLKASPGKVIFSVKDSGVGITDEDKANLFKEGGHGKDSVKVNVHSTGYGLFIAKNIVEAHKGKIWAESEGAGKGSTFIVELPLLT